MKIGDILLCKKDFSIYHTKGKYYKIISIKINVVDIEDNFSHSTEYMHNDNLPASRRIWNHFYIKKEERKLKLEKLNDRK